MYRSTMVAGAILGAWMLQDSAAHAAQRVGTYSQRSYYAGQDQLRFFTFVTQATLTTDSIQKEVGAFLAELASRNETAEIEHVPGLYTPPVTHVHALERGQIFVHGWINVPRQMCGWIAIDRSDDLFPRHRYLMNSGKTGEPEKGKNGLTYVVGRWHPTVDPSHALRLEIQMSASWVRWYVD
jgi:hypothetical protein